MPSAADFSIPPSLAAMAFLRTGFMLGLALASSVVAAWCRAPRLGTWLLGAGAALVVGYAGALGLASLGSGERVLAPGSAKYFCEIDCHLAYSVAAVERREGASGLELVVHVAVRFDPETTSPGRGDAPVTPNPRLVEVVDAAGRHYPVSPTETRAYHQANRASASLTDPLRPGESYAVALVFPVPSGIEEPRLWITGGNWVNRLLIGHERSPGHGKVYLALDQAGVADGVGRTGVSG